MNQLKTTIALLMIMSIGIYAETVQNREDNTTLEGSQTPVKIKTVRNILSSYDPVEHMKGQLRAGFIRFKEAKEDHASAFAVGGHFHLYTKRWNGLMAGAEAYSVLNSGYREHTGYLNEDFFNDAGKSFVLISQAYLDAAWGDTQLKVGRQSIDTPHADSDDIRMMPNYFEALTLSNSSIEALTLSAGYIDKMAGWENGVNSEKFIDVGQTLGAGQDIDGILYASAAYEGIKDLSISLWYYHYSDIAHVFYTELGYTHALSTDTTMTLGLQYNKSSESGASLLGIQDADTFGISIETDLTAYNLTLLAAYNKEASEYGAVSLSLGGGAFFTSMEDQTLDALAMAGSAWILGAGYNFKDVGMEGLVFGVAYGDFKAEDDALYHVNETDAILEYQWDEKVSAVAAFTFIKSHVAEIEDYHQLRVITNYNF
jgi:imipenem/basic amino acid-specific outer membrane pore